MDDELMFELRGPGGELWRLFSDGRTEGFPAGTLLVNYCLPHVARVIGEVHRKGISLATEQA